MVTTYIVEAQEYRDARNKQKAELIARSTCILATFYYQGCRLPPTHGLCPICLREGELGLLCPSPECDSFGVTFEPIDGCRFVGRDPHDPGSCVACSATGLSRESVPCNKIVLDRKRYG